MTSIQKNFIRKCWVDGRTGHTSYLMFFLVFLNFILIAFSYLIEGNQNFEKYISDLWIFAIIFVVTYIPVAILIGRWHTNTQISIEETIKKMNDPILATQIKTILNVQTGTASKKEIEEFRNFMSSIIKKDSKKLL